MPKTVATGTIEDRGGRRRLPDRRKQPSSDYFPERRSDRYRRSDSDRRSLQNFKVRKRKERRRALQERFSDPEN